MKRQLLIGLVAVVALSACSPAERWLGGWWHNLAPQEADANFAQLTPEQLASDAPVLTLEQMTALQAHVDALVAEASQPGCGPMIAAARARGDVTQYEIDRMVGIANRESHCFLGAHNYSTRTRDDSWGPFQINYYGALRARAVTIGSPESNTWSWAQAVDNMLKLARGSGWCHWTPGSYCS